MRDNIIELCHLSFGYNSSDRVLNNLNMSFGRQQLHVILGGNGSGKSTLLRVLRGLLPSQPGSVLYHGCQPWQEVGLVFQNPDNQIVGTTVLEDVAFGPANLGWPRAAIQQRVEAALTLVGLQDKRHHNPHHLSGGERQRLALAGVLAMNPKVLLLDEATSMLDYSSRVALLHLLKELCGQGITVLHVTHHLEEALEADQVWVLGQGQLRLAGTPAAVFDQEALLRELGLGLPPEQEFVAAVKKQARKRWDIPAHIKTNCGLASWVGENVRQGQPSLAPAEKVPGGEAIRLEQVSVEAILTSITASIPKLQCTALVGPSGAGKTTLARLLAGLITPSSGSVQLQGSCGLVLQYPEDQLFAATVLEDVMFGPSNMGLTKQQALKRAQAALAAVGLEAELFGSRNPLTLSGGQMRKVAIAGTLAMQPDILILDEPTVGLDPKSRASLLRLLKQLKDQHTLVVVTHDAELLDALADRMIILEQGHLIAEGKPLELLADIEGNEFCSLAVPQRVKLLQAMQRLGAQATEFTYWLKEADLYGE